MDIAPFTAYSPTHPTPVTNKAGMRGDTSVVLGKWKIGKREVQCHFWLYKFMVNLGHMILCLKKFKKLYKRQNYTFDIMN